MKITIGKVNISYDIDELIEDIKSYEWEEPYGNDYVDESHMTATQEEFDKLQKAFIKKLTDSNNSDKLYDITEEDLKKKRKK